MASELTMNGDAWPAGVTMIGKIMFNINVTDTC